MLLFNNQGYDDFNKNTENNSVKTESVYSKGRICLQPLIKSRPKIQEKFVISKERENQTLVLHQYIIDTEGPF